MHSSASSEHSVFGVVGTSAAARRLYQTVERVAGSGATVLIRGESGSGKEVIARALHELGPRSGQPFVAINCTTLPDGVLESELFGHVGGAFTGAIGERRGLFEEAHGGTIFLDEIGDMPFLLQAKILRVMEHGEIRAVGSDRTRRVDVRVIAATHQPIETRVRDGRFREDLYYRLNVVPIQVPALRDRRDDIPLLVDRFLLDARANSPTSPVCALTSRLLDELMRHPWHGNVRELRNTIERLVATGTQPIVDVDDYRAATPGIFGGFRIRTIEDHDIVPLHQVESEYIDWVIAQCGGNKTRAAELLGIDVSTVHRRRRSSGVSAGPKTS